MKGSECGGYEENFIVVSLTVEEGEVQAEH